jgi:3',5'-cyclic AMP phosphodiesterase CpdA
MFKKKRLALLFVLAILITISIKYSALYAVGLGVALVIAMAFLALYKHLSAHRGMDELEEIGKRYAYPALIEKLDISASCPLRVVVLGDTRNNRRVAAQVYEQAAKDAPAIVFHTGDIVRHGTAPELIRNHVALIEKYFGETPVFSVPGNHERGARRDFAAFRALHGDTRFAFEVNGCQFIGFNNSGKGRLPQEDFDWLCAALEGSQAKHRYVFFHIPPAFFEATFVSDSRRRGLTKRAEELHALFQKHGVEEVFMAHIHGYATTLRDNVRYTLTAGGGAPLSGRLAKRDRVYHYILLDIAGENVSREVVRLVDGEWQRGVE